MARKQTSNSIITSSFFPGGSLENLDRHVGDGDGLEVETDKKLEVIGTKSVFEESPENANELPALETTTNNETNLDDIASDEYEAVGPVIDQTSDNEVDNENITGEQEETIEDISNQHGGGLANHDMRELDEPKEDIIVTETNHIPIESELTARIRCMLSHNSHFLVLTLSYPILYSFPSFKSAFFQRLRTQSCSAI